MDYAVGLYAGGNLLVEDAGTLTPVSGFLTSQITYPATSSDSFLGETLEIRLTGGTINGRRRSTSTTFASTSWSPNRARGSW